MNKKEFMTDFGDYRARDGAAKKETTPPCAACGWGPEEAIHQNPKMIGGGGPYHDFKSK